MSVWVTRAGKHGEWEEVALSAGVVIFGGSPVGDISGWTDFKRLKAEYERLEPGRGPATVAQWASQLYRLAHRIEDGDYVLMPSKQRATVAIGQVTGPYAYRKDLGKGAEHCRPVKWIRTDVARTAFDAQMLSSLGSQKTIGRVHLDDADTRVADLLGARPAAPRSTTQPTEDVAVEAADAEDVDIERTARDRILRRIERVFHGHELARLVEAVLQAEGFSTVRSAPGPDGGVDILAAPGTLGFGAPQLCVQVKSGKTPADSTVFRSLKGTMTEVQATQGLLVSWAGHKDPVRKENAKSFFSVRLWDADDLVNAIFRTYDRLPPDIQAELPLQRIWTLVVEEE